VSSLRGDINRAMACVCAGGMTMAKEMDVSACAQREQNNSDLLE